MTHQLCDLSRMVPPVLMCACYQLLRHFLPCPLLVVCSSDCRTQATAFLIGRSGVCRELNAVLTCLFDQRNKTPVASWNKNCAGDSTLRTAKRRDKEVSSSWLSGRGRGDKKKWRKALAYGFIVQGN